MNASTQKWLADQIQTLKDQHLYKVPKILETPAGGRVRMNGKEVVFVKAKTVINFKSGFDHKLLCDGPTFSTGSACAPIAGCTG